jgi:hypothetical protein
LNAGEEIIGQQDDASAVGPVRIKCDGQDCDDHEGDPAHGYPYADPSPPSTANWSPTGIYHFILQHSSSL